jgi:hypothetical protein
MKNINEEIEILSHEEDHLDSNVNNNGRKISGDSDENLSQNKGENINQNLNIEETRDNNNIFQSQSQGEQSTSNNGSDMENKLKNFEPEKHYKNYGQSHHHHMHHHNHQHSFFDPKYLVLFIFAYVQMINRRIQHMFSGICMALDMKVRQSKFHPIIKRIIHSKQLLLCIYIINIQYLLSNVEKIRFLNILNNYSLGIMLLSMIGLYVHYYINGHKLFVEKDEELEKFIIKRNPQINQGRCEECGLIKIMRSYHCFFCGKCIRKYQLHSDWFNMCIGANNELVYAITLFFTNSYFFISNIIFWYYILVRADLLNYLVLIFSLFGLLSIYILFNSLKFLYNFIFDSLFVNLTIYEKNFARALSYLWKDAMRRGPIFNPFNKGLQRNIEELFVNTFDINIYSDYKNFACQNLSEIIDDDKINMKEEPISYNDDIGAFKLMIRLSEHFDPLITSKGNIYKFVDGKEIINWNQLVLFTAFDVINSPFKDAIIKQAKYTLKQRELYLESLKNNANTENNESKNNENGEAIEKIDNNENLESKKDKENQENQDNDKEENNNNNNNNEKDNDNEKS